jgi:hypothetical protein
MDFFYQWIKMILGATYMDVSKPKTTPQPANSTEKYRQPGQFPIASTSSS